MLIKILLSSLLLICCISSVSAGETRHVVSIPSQKLHLALIALGKQSRASIVFPTQLRKPVNSIELEGEFTLNQALELLLSDTGLSYSKITNNVFAIVPAPLPPVKTKPLEKVERPQLTKLAAIESVEVIGQRLTGSRIKQTDVQGSAPVDIITAQQLQYDGAFSLGGYLRYLPAVSGNSTNTAVSNGGNGTATVTLRGLPANNTLVLVNGQRVEFEGLAGDAVDLNSIPLNVIERVEVLKDGASAIYGSDAIAGVVNVVMKHSTDGFRFQQTNGISHYGDAQSQLTSFEFGQEWANSGFVVAANYYHQHGLYSRDRQLSASADTREQGGTDGRVSATPNARVHLPNGEQWILDEAYRSSEFTGSDVSQYRTATSEDLFDFRSQTSSISPVDRFGIYVAGFKDVNDKASLKGSLQFNRSDAAITLAATPLYTAATLENITVVSADHMYNPFGVDINDVRRRMMEFGPRVQRNQADSWRLQLQSDISDSQYDWTSMLYAGRTIAIETNTGLIDGDRVRQALGPSEACQGLATDGCVPLNIFAPENTLSQASIDYLGTSARAKGHSDLLGFSSHFSRKLFDLAAGEAMLALGFDLRAERSILKNTSSTGANLQNIVGSSLEPFSEGSRQTKEVYGELQIPLLRHHPLAYNLEAEFAWRYSHYSSFGEQVIPKFGIRYRPIESLMIRATRSEGFRAPSLKELNRTGFSSYSFLDDPCSRLENVGVLPGCSQLSDETRSQFLTIFQGAPDLKPEKSRSFTAGVFWTPSFIDGLSLSADTFRIVQTNVVDVDPQTIVDQNANNNLYTDLVERDELGNITVIYAPFINIGRRDILGVDISAQYSHRTARWGSFQYQINASHIHHYKVRIDDVSVERDFVGIFTDAATEGNGSLPKWKSTLGMQWLKGRWSAAYSVNFVGAQQEYIARLDTLRRINSWQSHDVQMSYDFGKSERYRLTLGFDNLFNSPPPFIAEAFNDNYDARTYDIRGQFGYLKVQYRH